MQGDTTRIIYLAILIKLHVGLQFLDMYMYTCIKVYVGLCHIYFDWQLFNLTLH